MVQHRRQHTIGTIEAGGVVAVIRLQDPARLRAVIDALAAGGVKALEITMSVPGAIRLIEEIAPTLPADFVIGAGTILDPETARAAILAGARFVVGPVFNRAVIDLCHRYDVAVMPGCFTPTEILTAWEAGADVVKVFPATALGPSYFKDIRGPLPQLKLMPTGGVSIENAGDWIAAGAVAIGVGTAMVDAKSIAAGRYQEITERASRFVDAVRAARGRAS
ncbi:MAG: bifunctional 4-hydroxy-2-oxoglutarate aldolase/2-dehydro-3-deoxy-phosphogluconate aldolase [Acidobacteria bacterium]|nr:bifunctional 4-hydroxy-2-oxoglutarate aldolase/2-dehydro-3-deoxy-phosphogluconate aldolase [Acidobacteriota bacterium]